MITKAILFMIAAVFLVSSGCAAASRENIAGATPVPVVQATPSRTFTPADVAKLKWIEGTWRGMDGDKPFYERYRVETTAMVVEGLKVTDSSADDKTIQVESTDRFELKDGEFGKGEGDKRSAASAIGDGFVQFVPAVAGKGNNFRFERQPDGTWNAILEWPASADKPARQKIYKMEPWPKK